MSDRRVIYRPRVQRITVQRRVQSFSVRSRGPQGPAGVAGERGVTAAADIATHKIVRMNSNGEAVTANAATLSDGNGIVGMSVVAGSSGAAVTIRTSGPIEDNDWNWSLAVVFAGLNGAPTQDLTGLAFLEPIGEATAPTRIELNFGQLSYQL